MKNNSRLYDLDTGQSLSSSELCNEQSSNASNSSKLCNEQSSNASNVKRMSVNLSGDIARLLEFLAESQGISQNEALRKAIATEAYLLQERQQGTKVLLQKSDKEIREVLFR